MHGNTQHYTDEKLYQERLGYLCAVFCLLISRSCLLSIPVCFEELQEDRKDEIPSSLHLRLWYCYALLIAREQALHTSQHAVVLPFLYPYNEYVSHVLGGKPVEAGCSCSCSPSATKCRHVCTPLGIALYIRTEGSYAQIDDNL